MGSPSVSVVVPCYNEALNIERHVKELEAYFQKKPFDYELVLIDDGSKDNTFALLQQAAKRNNRIKALTHGYNRGRGAGLKTGFANATKDVIVTLDADLSYAPYHIERLVSAMQSQHADIAQASPYHAGGTARNIPFFRLLVSRWGNKLLTRSIYREFTVVTCIVRAYRREAIQSIYLQSEGKEIHLEILSKARDLGLRVIEIPGDLRWRDSKKKSGPKRKPSFTFSKMAMQHISYGLHEAPIFFIGLLGVLFLLIGLALAAFFLVQYFQGVFNPQRPLVTVMIIFFLAGVQTILFSFLSGQNRYLKKELTVVQFLLLRKK